MTDSFQNTEVFSFPEIESIDFKKIEKNYFKVILINVLILFLTLFIGAFFVVYKDWLELGQHYIWIFSALILLLIFTVIFEILGFKKRKYAVREKDISYKKGLLYKSLTTVPFNRIQHVEIDQGPISRFFGLATLSVFTAGDSSDDLKIKGLLKEQSLHIKEFITNKIDG
ncbi:hypothetical protein BXQ17_00420 [Polaribacter sp. BM10]|uniref:PH domain-containing protein n=1 Tax=Polaribacter sp. BM10 TaxID=1529069 RepID=UPI000989F8DB|nr:PH domain-containing protein [Polaribacter sp. BM10]AQS92621.1 hypothetical protein BXQ17_00420 [Polaribacter sp. BM10]